MMRDDQVTRLLRLRAAPPAVSPGFVRRPHLEDRITAAVRGPVTLVSAGPGYGKTLTLASWARGGRAPGPVAWLAMDETDNHVQSFWSDVLGALAVVDIVPADSALRHMTPAAGFGARELTQIREALAELPAVLVLVLDDFQQVSNPAVLESFGQLLDHQPPQLRLVLATRSDPALRLHRLRVNGEVTDVRAHDLAFGSTEAAQLFARNGFRLSEGQLTVLLDRTQGWAAGLRLALMCLDPGDIDGGISRFTGSDHLVAEYLIEEVTDQLPEQDREFLLMTSVADRLAAGLANELPAVVTASCPWSDWRRATRWWWTWRAGRSGSVSTRCCGNCCCIGCLGTGQASLPMCTCGRRGGSPSRANRSPPSGTPVEPWIGTRSGGCWPRWAFRWCSLRAARPWWQRWARPRPTPLSPRPPVRCWPRRCATIIGTISRRWPKTRGTLPR